MLMWHHGTVEKQWCDSGWVLDGVFYPVQYTNNPNGPDKVLGRKLTCLDAKRYSDKYHPNVVKDCQE